MIDSVIDWLKRHSLEWWIVVGKGPSLDRIALDAARFQHLTLNHACTRVEPTLAHFTDLEAYLDCWPRADCLAHVVMPWYPHVKMAPGKQNLDELCRLHPSLAYTRTHGRLHSYNSSRTRRARHRAGLPEVRVRLFSAVPAFNMLAMVGCKIIYSVGVDGGTGYARGMNPKDKLANGQPSFDAQFKEIERSCRVYGVRHVRI